MRLKLLSMVHYVFVTVVNAIFHMLMAGVPPTEGNVHSLAENAILL